MISNRLTQVLEKSEHKLLSVFYTAGFPYPETTIEIAHHLQDAGVDLIEIGIPFSDPIADGPVIQESNKTALDQGISLKKILGQVKLIRQQVSLPILLMGYLNPVVQYGVERFIEDAATAGVDGVILPDLPLHEFQERYQKWFDANQLSCVFLISPQTSDSRIREIDNASTGFVYAVSSSSTTGAKGDFTDDQLNYFKRIQNLNLKNRFLVGFGISNHNTFEKATRYSSGAIVGSSFITLLKDSKNLKSDIHQYVSELKGKAS